MFTKLRIKQIDYKLIYKPMRCAFPMCVNFTHITLYEINKMHNYCINLVALNISLLELSHNHSSIANFTVRVKDS